ncbi:MAG: hypothetical protein K2H05_01710 [Duncaniella sp.]|nr:hypothetical protein [Duncaniella sp.]
MELLTNIVGYGAAICMVMGYLPQAIHTIRTKETDGIALPTFLLLGMGSILFVVQGLLLHNWPLFITNAITTVCSAVVFGIKIHNDFGKKKQK